MASVQHSSISCRELTAWSFLEHYPKSNAHGPNEFLHVPYAKKLTAAVAQVIEAAAVGPNSFGQVD